MPPGKREVQIVTCPTFPVLGGGKRKRPEADHDKEINIPKRNTNTAKGRKGRGELEEDFGKIYRSVIELGASQFKGRDKRSYEERRIVNLGGKAPKNIKTPYNILMGKKAYQKKRAEKDAQALHESGIVAPKKKKATARKEKKDEKGKVTAPKPTGKFIGGTLYVNPNLLKKKS